MALGKHTGSKMIHFSGIVHTDNSSDSQAFGQKNLQHCSTLDYGVDVLQKMDRKERKSQFFFQVFCSALSSLSSSSQRRKPASAHRRAVMWFQCLGPCGIVPSGGKPLRLCWHITTPIINSRSALSFLLHLSSFLLTAAFFCFAWALISAPGSFTLNTFLLIFCLNSHTFFFFWRCTALNDCHSHHRSTDFTRPGQDLARKRHSSILNCEDDQTGEDLMIRLVCRRLSLKHYNPHETITFKLGASNQKTSRIDSLLPTFTSQVSYSSIPLLFSLIILFFLPPSFQLLFIWSDNHLLVFPHFSLLSIPHPCCNFLSYIYLI